MIGCVFEVVGASTEKTSTQHANLHIYSMGISSFFKLVL